MADEGQLWSLKNDGGHVLGSRPFNSIFPIDATNIPSDITIQVPDRDNFLKHLVNLPWKKRKSNIKWRKKILLKF